MSGHHKNAADYTSKCGHFFKGKLSDLHMT